jgi:hypothetical protein
MILKGALQFLSAAKKNDLFRLRDNGIKLSGPANS